MKPQEGEDIIHQLRPEPNILVIWFFTKCLPTAFIGGFITFIAFSVLLRDIFLGVSIIVSVIAPIILILVLIYCSYLRSTYIYYVTNQRCIFHGGILRRIERSVPYHKITDVEMSQNIIERVLGISTLNIFTPGTGSMYQGSPFRGQKAEISFVGLKDNETPAESINQILRKFKATGE